MSSDTSTSSQVVALEGLLRDLRRYHFEVEDETARAEIHAILDRADEVRQLDDDEQAALLHELVRLCVQARMQPLLSQNNIAHPVYNFLQGFESNFPGPWDRQPEVGEITSPIAWRLLGYDVKLPVGVPASVLTANVHWVTYFARRGFNILTYKSVRSQHFEAHDYPHWVFLDGPEAPWFTLDEVRPVVTRHQSWPKSFGAFSTANSFGVPSSTPIEWQRDVEATLAALDVGQLLIVSVMGSSDIPGTDIVKDFVRVARYAEETGAHAVELNLSCPNTVDPAKASIKEPVCRSPELTAQIVTAVRDAIKGKLVLKLTAMDDGLIREVLEPLIGTFDAVSGINTVQTRVTAPDGDPIFVGTAADHEQVRWEAGISGYAIGELASDFVRSVASIRNEQNADFDIIGMGGVMTGDDIERLWQVGANAVQSATGAACNTRLAQEVLEQGILSLDEKVVTVFRPGISLDPSQVAAGARMAPTTAKEALERLVRAGVLRSRPAEKGRLRYFLARTG